MRFNVGDVVTVRNDLVSGTRYYMDGHKNWDSAVEEMCVWSGKMVTIAGISDTEKYFIEQDNDDIKWCWTDEMFEEFFEEER